jgi:dihydroflavonol-4-reductase
MRVVVTGATGHVGANLVRTLVARGDQVKVVVRARTTALAGVEVERVSGDVRDAASLRAAFTGAEVVYHLAAVISITGDPSGEVRAVNVDGARNAAEAALAAGVRRLVHCSSVHAFDLYLRNKVGPIDETWPRVPDYPPHFAYDRSKAAGELAVRDAIGRGLEAVIVHPSGVVGPYDFGPSRMGRVLLQLQRRTLPSLVEGAFDFVDVRDVADGLIAASERGTPGENYLLTGNHVKIAELAAAAQAITGIRPPRIQTPIWVARLGVPFFAVVGKVQRAEPLYTHESLTVLQSKHKFDTAKARRDLGYAPRPLEDTLRDTYAWFKSAGMLSAA